MTANKDSFIEFDSIQEFIDYTYNGISEAGYKIACTMPIVIIGDSNVDSNVAKKYSYYNWSIENNDVSKGAKINVENGKPIDSIIDFNLLNDYYCRISAYNKAYKKCIEKYGVASIELHTIYTFKDYNDYNGYTCLVAMKFVSIENNIKEAHDYFCTLVDHNISIDMYGYGKED